MKLDRILPYARKLLQIAVEKGSIVVDGTVGNGHDTLFLANLVGEDGHVYGFDIQLEAIENTTAKLKEHHVFDRVTLVNQSHSQLMNCIPEPVHGKIAAAIFNLGYLPGGDKQIVTQPDSTISAIEQLLKIMAPEGIIVVVIYHGHEEGAFERDCLLAYVKTIDQQMAHVLSYRFLNQVNNPPFILAIEKR